MEFFEKFLQMNEQSFAISTQQYNETQMINPCEQNVITTVYCH